MSRSVFNERRLTTPVLLKAKEGIPVDITIPSCRLLEDKQRISKNPNDYYSSKKVLMNLRSLAPHGNFRTFSKPDYLKVH